MVSKAAFSVFALLAVGVSASMLSDSVCQQGAQYDPDRMLQKDMNMTCDQTLQHYLSAYLDRTSFDDMECKMIIEAEGNMTIHKALLYTQLECCHGAPMGLSGMCGDNFPEGSVCVDPMHFTPGAGIGHGHCIGDEMIMDEALCNMAGYGAWDPMQEEKCDVGRLPGEDWVRTQACEKIGGMWEELKCVHFYDRMQESGAISDPMKVCMDRELTMDTFHMFGDVCCKNQTTGYPAPKKHVECPMPIKDHVCGDAQFMPWNVIPGDDEGTSCSALVAHYLHDKLDREEFSHEECEAMVYMGDDEDEPPSLRMILSYIQMYCCSEMSAWGMCGGNFDKGTVCLYNSNFRPNETLGMYHCMGDENIMDENECKRAGEDAWSPYDYEMCDVGRLPLDEQGRQAACEMLGGSWEEYGCMMFHMHLSGEGMFEPEGYCRRPDLHELFKMTAERCCKNDDWSEAEMQRFACGGGGGGGSCTTISKADEQRLTNMGHRLKYC